MRRHLKIAIIALGCSLPLFPARTAAQSFNFVAIDVPCNACPGGIARRTAIGGINPGGDIVGVYTDAVGKSNGFLLSSVRPEPCPLSREESVHQEKLLGSLQLRSTLL